VVAIRTHDVCQCRRKGKSRLPLATPSLLLSRRLRKACIAVRKMLPPLHATLRLRPSTLPLITPNENAGIPLANYRLLRATAVTEMTQEPRLIEFAQRPSGVRTAHRKSKCNARGSRARKE